jgi:hypothetical protein
LSLEADPRHAEMLMKALDLDGKDAKSVSTPGVKAPEVDYDAVLGDDADVYDEPTTTPTIINSLNVPSTIRVRFSDEILIRAV